MQLQAMLSGVYWQIYISQDPDNDDNSITQQSILTIDRSTKRFFLFTAQLEILPKTLLTELSTSVDSMIISPRSAGPSATRSSRRWCTYNQDQTSCASSFQAPNYLTATARTRFTPPTSPFTCSPPTIHHHCSLPSWSQKIHPRHSMRHPPEPKRRAMDWRLP